MLHNELGNDERTATPPFTPMLGPRTATPPFTPMLSQMAEDEEEEGGGSSDAQAPHRRVCQ